MAKRKDSFLMYYEWEDTFSDLDDRQLGELLRAVFAYEKRKEEYTGSDGAVRLAMRFIQRTLDRNQEKYDRVCERNRQNISKRWESDTKNTTGKSGIPNDTKNTDRDRDRDREHDRDRDSDSDRGSDRDAAKGAAGGPTPPTKGEVQGYIRENGLNVDAERFYQHYDQRRWLTQNGRPVDWKKRAEKWSKSEWSRPAVQVSPEGEAERIRSDYEDMKRLLECMEEETP